MARYVGVNLCGEVVVYHGSKRGDHGLAWVNGANGRGDRWTLTTYAGRRLTNVRRGSFTTVGLSTLDMLPDAE